MTTRLWQEGEQVEWSNWVAVWLVGVKPRHHERLPLPCPHDDFLCSTMKPPQKSELAKRVKALVDELSAVRAVVLDKQPAASPGERALFEARLFES